MNNKQIIFFLLLLFSFKLIADEVIEHSFQYNAYQLNIIHFDTEETVILYLFFNQKPLKKTKIKIFLPGNQLISSGQTDEQGFYRFPNQEYSQVLININNSQKYHKIKLNRIKKTKSRIFSVYQADDDVVRFFGQIKQSQKSKQKISLQVQLNHQNKTIFNKILTVSDADVFDFSINKDLLTHDQYQVIYKIKGQVVKTYQFFQKEKTFSHTQPVPPLTHTILKIESPVLYHHESKVAVDIKKNLDQIDSILYSIRTSAREIEQNILSGQMKSRFYLPLPDLTSGALGKYQIHFEVIYKNGISHFETATLFRLNCEQGDLLIKNQAAYENSISAYNPFTRSKALLILFNQDIQQIKLYDLKKGRHQIDLDKNKLPYCKALLIIKDQSSSKIVSYLYTIYQAKKIIPAHFQINKKLDYYQMSNRTSYLNRKSVFIYFVPYTCKLDPLFCQLNRFNDQFSGRQDQADYFPGTVKFLNEKIFSLKIPYQINHHLYMSYLNPIGTVFTRRKTYYKKQDLLINYTFPRQLLAGDQPQIIWQIKNTRKDKRELSLFLFSPQINSFSQKIVINLEPFQSKTTRLPFSPALAGKNIQLIFLIRENNRLINLKPDNIAVQHKKSFPAYHQLSGQIMDDRSTSSFVEIPDVNVKNYYLRFVFSNQFLVSPYIKNNYLEIMNIELFEYQFLLFLQEYIYQQYESVKVFPTFLNHYLIPGQGIKKYRFDRQINLDSTLLFLLAAKFIPLLKNTSGIDQIVQYLIKNYKKELLNSPLKIFILAELGYYFKEIDRQYLKKLKEAHVFFHLYYQKNKLQYPALTDYQSEIIYDQYRLSPHLPELIDWHYHKNKDQDFSPNFSFKIIEDIFLKLFYLNQRPVPGTSPKMDLSFKSKILGNFQESIQGKNILIKDFHFYQDENFMKTDKIIQFSIQKQGKGTLYYLLEMYHASFLKTTGEQPARSLTGQWLDDQNKIIDVEKDKLKNQTWYRMVLHLKNQLPDHPYLLLPLRCSALKIDYDQITCNNMKCKLIHNGETYILLENLNKEKNEIIIPIKTNYQGTFSLDGSVLVQINDFNRLVKEKNYRIDIE